MTVRDPSLPSFTPENVRPRPVPLRQVPRSTALAELRKAMAAKRIPGQVLDGAAGLLVCVPNRTAARAVEEFTHRGFRGYTVQVERVGTIGSPR